MSENWKNQMNAAVLKMLQRRDAEKRAEDAKRCAAEWEGAPLNSVEIDDLVGEFEATPGGIVAMARGREWVEDLDQDDDVTEQYRDHREIE